MNPPKKFGGRPTLCLDFDGVLHWYRKGWQGNNIIEDEPVPGAVDFVTRAQRFFKVVVYSSRSSHEGGNEAMHKWMQQHGFPDVDFADRKPAAFLTIDDRALTFNGDWPDPEQLRAFQPWTRQEQPEPGNSTGTTLEESAPEEGGLEESGPKEGAPKEGGGSLRALIEKNRSVRRFRQDQPVEMDVLRGLVDLARLSPSGANLQPLKYLLANTPEKNALIFEHLGWAGYLRDWPGPVEGERPAAYIIILGDSAISKSFGCDHGIAAQSIMLGAVEQGLSGCMLGSVKRAELSAALNIPPQLEILLVLALGKPHETVRIEPLGADGSIKYWRDEQQVHHVPKRSLEEIII